MKIHNLLTHRWLNIFICLSIFDQIYQFVKKLFDLVNLNSSIMELLEALSE